jgi:D-alanine-D-alanine ligase
MKNIAIIMGGYSSEISLISGILCTTIWIKQNRILRPYTERKVGLRGRRNRNPIDKNDFSVTVDENKINFECVFNAIHGTPGEDGLMQAYLELLEIPQTSDYYQAALTFNKRDFLSVLKPYSAVSYYLNKGDKIYTDEIVKK